MDKFVLCLISLILLNLASAVVFRHEVHYRESLKTKLIREGRLAEYATLKQRQMHGKFSNFKSTSQNINNYENSDYYVNITIGTPGQFFTVALVTGDAILLIPDINCQDCEKVRKFDSSKSSTYQKTDRYMFNNTDEGPYGQDFVRFGNPGTDQLIIPKTMFGQALIGITGNLIDGVMGLGFTAENPDGVDPPIITAIKSGILDSPVVTLFLRNVNGSSLNNGGVITYGAVDTINCDRNVAYESSLNPNRFEFSVKKVSLGSVQFSGNWNASIEIPRNVISSPSSIGYAFIDELNATSFFHIPDYYVNCNIKFTFNLTIGSTIYTLTEKELVDDYKYNGLCFLKLGINNEDTWGLGTSFLEKVCTVLDYGNKRVGFSKIVT